MMDLYLFWKRWPERLCLLFIEGHGIAGHQPPHDLADRRRTGTQQQVKMVWNQRPGITLGLGFFEDDREAVEEGLSVDVILEERPSLNSSGHHVLQKAGSV